MAWSALVLAVFTAAFLPHLASSAADTLARARAEKRERVRELATRKPGDVLQPKIVIPGEWLTDEAEHFLLLPLTVPPGLEAGQCKVLANGDALLVVVTEQPQDEPETMALRKFRLMMEAIKDEAGHDEQLLQNKLQTWFETEDDEEVRVRVRASLDSLTAVRQAKLSTEPRSVAVRLGLVHKVKPSFLARADAKVTIHAKAAASGNTTSSRASPADGQQALHSLRQHDARRSNLIKESFAVEIPYPVPSERIFLLKTDPGSLVVGMPLVRNSLEANGISTGGKPYARVPVFGVDGKLLAGPTANLHSMAAGLKVDTVAKRQGLKPLLLQ